MSQLNYMQPMYSLHLAMSVYLYIPLRPVFTCTVSRPIPVP